MRFEVQRVGANFPVAGCRLRGGGRVGIVQPDGSIRYTWYRDVRKRVQWRLYDRTGKWVGKQ